MKIEHVNGENRGKILLYALSTCGWCKKTKGLLNKLGVEYSYIYVDLVEILHLPDIYAGGPTLDKVLTPLDTIYDFEDVEELPPEISLIGTEWTQQVKLTTDEAHLPYGHNSLRLDVNLEPYDYQTGVCNRCGA